MGSIETEVEVERFVEETMGLSDGVTEDSDILGRKMSWKEFETRSRLIRSLQQMPFEVLRNLWQAATALEITPNELLQPNEELSAFICSGSVHLRRLNEAAATDASKRDSAFYMAKGESFDVFKLYNMGFKAYGGEGGALVVLINTRMWKLYRTRILTQYSARLERFLNGVLKFPAKRGFHPFKLRRVPGGTVVVKEGDPLDAMVRKASSLVSKLTCDRVVLAAVAIRSGRPSTPVMRFVRKVDQSEDVGSSVAFFSDSKSKLQASRVLSSTRSKHVEGFPKWLWTVCVPADEEEAYFVMIPMKQIRNLPERLLEKLDQEASDRVSVWIRALKAAAIRDESDRLPSSRSRSLNISSSSMPNSARYNDSDGAKQGREHGAVSSRSEIMKTKKTGERYSTHKSPRTRAQNLFSPDLDSRSIHSFLTPRTENMLLVQGRTVEKGSKGLQ
ncbi:hypothetical protein GUITHDRAFT_103089 [Guillardia theta CCMP2712]|uniref:Uncharacterized protein n=1 Tax=Guillardia theta (strain CCMP2712) TaxID=905079 RepID=L1JSK2_GUITC|nr:hypothetical protein GUITHDRAFT_103089 [Guillardia theta CCMP2712]EKX51170.1 hypothetical protein GUITHDRAFT_103089 [Guillardia theta CCMP2712]|eukprot:XP_005838150.1 hypothetical protein GUITHDRAFT_103089 [Guillardia theta CCMP2712]